MDNGDTVAYDEEVEEFDCAMTEFVGRAGIIQGENPLPPAVGMEFESYEDVYYFFNCYAKEQGFGVRVSNTWYRKSRERYRGKLSCSSAGFKKKSEANRSRPETRTGCPAMIKFRLMENKRWRIIELELEHNHLISPVSGKVYKSHRKTGLGSKRPLHMDDCVEARKIRLFRTVVIDSEDNETLMVEEGDLLNNVDYSNNQLRLKQGDAQAMYNFFSHRQLMDPHFFYVMDLNEKGCLRNVFWADAKARAAYGYFGDIIIIDSSCQMDKYEVPLVVFTGVNHHGQSVPLGCGLVANDSIDSFIWLCRAWLTYMVGRPPQTLITNYSKSLRIALADVFPRASHCFSLSNILKKFSDELGGLQDYKAIKVAFDKAVYYSMRIDEFETAWEELIQFNEITEHKWLQILYEDRKRWVPVYLKETFFAGMLVTKESGIVLSPFEGYLFKHTPLKEFFNTYGEAMQVIDKREEMADLESKNSSCKLKSSFYFEMHLSKLYTNGLFKKFQGEIEGIYSCLNTRKISIDGSVITYIVKDHAVIDENRSEIRDYEVVYNTSDAEIVCECGLFNFKGYLCRHALSILSQNNLEEIPPQYILERWRKDFRRSYAFDHGCNDIDISNPIHRYDNLFKCVLKVVEEGRKSQDRYKFTLQAVDEMLNKVRLEEDVTI